MLEMNTYNMIEWMARIALDDPAKALSICADLAEFIVPKLARTEIDQKIDQRITHVEIMVSDARTTAPIEFTTEAAPGAPNIRH